VLVLGTNSSYCSVKNIRKNSNTYIRNNGSGTNLIDRGYRLDSPPTDDYWNLGEKIYNRSPSVDANNMVLIGWVCVTAGTPGTWEPMYVSTVSPAT